MQKLNHKMQKLEENRKNRLEKKKHRAMIESWKKWKGKSKERKFKN